MGNYITQGDIEQFTGFSNADFKYGGTTMTATQWATFATNVCAKVTQMINRFCCVTTLETHTATEYHSGRNDGAQDFRNYFTYVSDNANTQYYTDLDKSFYLFEVCQIATTVKVEEDTTTTSTPNWTTRDIRTATATGDYDVFQHNDLTAVRFINNVPCRGRDNVRITYTAGYASGSVELDAINLIAIEIAQNLLLRKKKVQEATTIRGTGVRDYSPMFELQNERDLLSQNVREQLMPYRRHMMLDDVYSPF